MKKTSIYAVICAALLIFGALTAVYGIRHPGRIIPSPEYTKLKATYLTANYIPAAEELGIEKNKRGSTFYAAAIEFSTPELEKSEGVTAQLYFFDALNKYAHVKSNGVSRYTAKLEGTVSHDLTYKAAALFDASFTEAGDSDYGIPGYGQIKLYLRRGDGVYIKLYEADEFPAELIETIGALPEPGQDTASDTGAE